MRVQNLMILIARRRSPHQVALTALFEVLVSLVLTNPSMIRVSASCYVLAAIYVLLAAQSASPAP
jgi:hypothetical protein